MKVIKCALTYKFDLLDLIVEYIIIDINLHFIHSDVRMPFFKTHEVKIIIANAWLCPIICT